MSALLDRAVAMLDQLEREHLLRDVHDAVDELDSTLDEVLRIALHAVECRKPMCSECEGYAECDLPAWRDGTTHQRGIGELRSALATGLARLGEGLA